MVWTKQDNEKQANEINADESGQGVMGNVVRDWNMIIWCGVPSDGSQGHSISEGSCDTKDRRYAENSALITITGSLHYIHIQNSHFKFV